MISWINLFEWLAQKLGPLISWLIWPADRLARKLSERRVEQIQRSLGKAGYVDDDLWSGLLHISGDEAHEELERGVRTGYLERMLLYQDESKGISFLAPESLVGNKIRLSEVGYFADVDDPEVKISKYLKRVYVAAESDAQAASDVAEEV